MTKWITALLTPKKTLEVDRGRVHCPGKQHDVEVDLCLSCPHLRAVTRYGKLVSEIACSPPRETPVVPLS
jgi:hypothetical protein